MSPEAPSSPFTSSVGSWGLSPGPGTPHLLAGWHESPTPWACTVLSQSPGVPCDLSRDWNGQARAARGEPLLKPRCTWLRTRPASVRNFQPWASKPTSHIKISSSRVLVSSGSRGRRRSQCALPGSVGPGAHHSEVTQRPLREQSRNIRTPGGSGVGQSHTAQNPRAGTSAATLSLEGTVFTGPLLVPATFLSAANGMGGPVSSGTAMSSCASPLPQALLPQLLSPV